jgi:pimeloyl-ACP methyl ester carboxylesterase
MLSPPSTSSKPPPKSTNPLPTTNPPNIHLLTPLPPLLKISSPLSASKLGTIFTLFGGAGNSCIQDLITTTSGDESLLDSIDPDFNYDSITFDNRGFGYSSPSAKCFPSVLDGVMTSRGEDEKGVLVRLAAAKGKGELCEGGGEADIRQYMTTAYAARDMLEILKRLPEEHGKKTPKLKFLGLSYGTMVGQTFASLYPEHVSRMVLDGTVDAKDWSRNGRCSILSTLMPFGTASTTIIFKPNKPVLCGELLIPTPLKLRIV